MSAHEGRTHVGDITMTRPETEVAGDGELVVSQTVDRRDLRVLLESLVHEDCVHSWRNFGPDGTLERLLEWENARRPTQLFFFHLKQNGKVRMVAASAVADRLTRDFPDPGFCVLGRCYIMPEFRSRGFYRHVLRYRLEHCRTQFGNALNAIHIGAVNERISRVIMNHELSGWPRFVHMGEEELGVAGEIRTVGAYLLFVPDYLRRIHHALAGDGAPPGVIELRAALARIESAPVHDLGACVRTALDEARRCGWFDGRDCRALAQLLRFCRSVPLVGFR
jgi:GNAT superfamily N-acetyltransferase